MAASRTKEPSYSAPALEKGLDILELLAGEAEGISQQQVAKKLGRSASEIFRMMTCLRSRGYVTRGEADDLYRLSPKLFSLAHQHPPTERLHEAAMPILRRLAHRVEQSCHLGVPDAGRLLILSQVDAPGFLRFTVRVGMHMPLHQTSSGRVLLAFQDQETRATWLDLAFEDAGGEGSRRTVAKQLKDIVRNGYERHASDHVDGIVDLAVPVLDRSGHAVCALTVPYLAQIGCDRAADQVLQEIIASASSLSRQLGYGIEK